MLLRTGARGDPPSWVGPARVFTRKSNDSVSPAVPIHLV